MASELYRPTPRRVILGHMRPHQHVCVCGCGERYTDRCNLPSILRLRHMDHMTYEQIAAACSVNHKTVTTGRRPVAYQVTGELAEVLAALLKGG